MKYRVASFGLINEKKTEEIYVENEHGAIISFTNLGARINRWIIPLANGERVNVILGYNDAEHVLDGRGYYYGATIGRVAGRIDKGRFSLNKKTYSLEKNDGLNHLHGGSNGLDLVIWDYEIIESPEALSVVFFHYLKSEVDGYPGNMNLKVTHTFNNKNEWKVRYEGQTDETTLFNPTNHVYFNLNGDNQTSIINHEFQLMAPYYLPLREDTIPEGKAVSVEGTPFNMQKAIKFEDILQVNHPQLKLTSGFDHPFVLDLKKEVQAMITSPATLLQLTMKTDQPMVVVYTHNVVPQPMKVWGNDLQPYAGFTLETQQAPDAINQPSLGNVILEPEQVFISETTYRINSIK